MNPQRGEMRTGLRRGIYVVPTLFTVLNLFFGFRAIVNSLQGSQAIANGELTLATHYFELACISIFIAAVFDTFDGMIARALGATSEFGKEYDSLADVVTFGVAPAVLVYAWGLHVMGKLGAGIAFLHLIGGSLRLARFNVMTGKTDYRFFVGLPIPAGAMTLASIIFYAPAPVTDDRFAIVMLIVTAAVGFAMVSPIRYRSQKGLVFAKERSMIYFLAIAAIIGIAYRWPRQFLFGGAVAYLSSGPLMRLWSIAFPSRKPPEPHQEVIEHG
jgi:CDP-diacylglycerol--serine O-phosphatidyltransferase